MGSKKIITSTRKLDFIELRLSTAPGKCQMIREPTTYVGFAISQYGMNVEDQINKCIKAADKRFWTLIRMGIWKGNYKDDLALAAYRSQVIPILEYGVAIFRPTADQANKVDIMINRHIRTLLGSPMYTPVEDMRTIFQYAPFISRWSNLYARFKNHQADNANKPKDIIYTEPCVWSFQLSNSAEALIQTNPFLRKFFLLIYAPPTSDTICPKCQNHHQYINGYIQCYMKAIPLTIESQDMTRSVESKIWETEANKYRQTLRDTKNHTTVHAWADGSYLRGPSKYGTGNIGTVVVTSKYVKTDFKSANHLRLNSSTGCKVAAIISILQRFHNKTIHIYSDNFTTMRRPKLESISQKLALKSRNF